LDVIVQFKQNPLTGEAEGFGAVRQRFNRIHAVHMRIPAAMLPFLQASPNVAYVTPNRSVSLTATPDEDQTLAVEGDIAASRYNMTGNGIGVAVIDSGISDHQDLHAANGASIVVYNESFVTGDTSTNDKYGHGTHVAGLIAGSGSASALGSSYARQY